MNAPTQKYTVGRIIDKLFPFAPELSIPLALITPILAVVSKKLPWLFVLPLGVWVLAYVTLLKYPKKSDSPLEWILAMIRFTVGALFAWFLWWLGQPWE